MNHHPPVDQIQFLVEALQESSYWVNCHSCSTDTIKGAKEQWNWKGLCKNKGICLGRWRFFKCNGIQVAFILLFTSQLTVFNNHLWALDTTLRILNTWYKLHVMNYITHIQDVHNIAGPLVPYNHACPKRDWSIAIETVLLSDQSSTSKPSRLDWKYEDYIWGATCWSSSWLSNIWNCTINNFMRCLQLQNVNYLAQFFLEEMQE